MLDIAVQETAKLCKRFEGFRSKPYICPAGVPTIGYGATYYSNGNPVTMKDAPLSEQDAHALLEWHIRKVYLPGTISMCPNLVDKPYKLAAITDFCFNLGLGRLKASTLRKRILASDWAGAEVELNKWTKGGGKVLPGLVLRRQTEIALMKL